MSLTTDLQAQAKAYCEARNISLSRLATIVANDGKLFDRVAAGGDMTTRMYERFQAYFAANPVPPKADKQSEGAPPQGAAA